MTKPTITLTLLFVACISTSAQHFSKTYKINPLSQINNMARAEEAVEAIPMADGGYLIAGHMNTVPNAGYHPYVLKINASGDSLWSKIYDYWNGGSPFKFYKDNAGNYQLAVDAFLAGPENRAIIVQVDSTNGDTISTKTLPKYPNTNSMGTYHDMEILPDGSIILAYRDDAGGTGAQGDVGHLYKINASGNTTWEFENDGTNATYQYFHDIYWDGSSLVCTGMEIAGSNNYIGEWVVTSLDTAGQLEWTTTLTGPNTGWGYRWLTLGNTIAQNSQGEYLVGGGFKYDNPDLPLEGTVVTFSANGDSINSSRLAESRGINHIIPTGQGDFMATGTGLYIDSSGGFDEYFDKALLARVSASGQIQAYNLAGDTNYYPGAFGQSTAAYYGNYLLPVSGNDYIVFGSGFRNSQDGANQTITFVSKMAAPTIGLQENLHTPTVSIYPNPAGDYLLVEGLENSPATLTIHDLSGRTVLEAQAYPNRKVDISQLPAGNYLIYFGEQLMQQKLVVR